MGIWKHFTFGMACSRSQEVHLQSDGVRRGRISTSMKQLLSRQDRLSRTPAYIIVSLKSVRIFPVTRNPLSNRIAPSCIATTGPCIYRRHRRQETLPVTNHPTSYLHAVACIRHPSTSSPAHSPRASIPRPSLSLNASPLPDFASSIIQGVFPPPFEQPHHRGR
jgi:hypothetical protein